MTKHGLAELVARENRHRHENDQYARLSAMSLEEQDSKNVRQKLEQQSMDVLGSSPQEFAEAIRRDIEHWRVAVNESGAQIS